MKKKNLAIVLFSVAFLLIVVVSALVLWQKDVFKPQPPARPMEQPTVAQEQDPLLYPALADTGLWGFINHQGTEKIPAVYRQADFFAGDIAWVQNSNGQWGAVNTSGQVVIEPVYGERTYVDDGSSGLVAAANESGSSLYDGNGNKLFGVEGEIGLLSNGLMAFSRPKDGKVLWGYVNTSGKIVVEPVYQAVGLAGEENVIVENFDSKKLLLNRRSGDTVELAGAIELNSVGSGRVLFLNEDGKYGYLGPDGQTAIEPVYGKAEAFHKGAALAWNGQGCGLLGPDGQWLVQPSYETGEYLGSGYFSLGKKEEESFFIFDAQGKQITPEPAYEIGSWQKGILPLQTATKTRFLQAGAGVLPKPAAELQYDLTYVGNLFAIFDGNGMAYYELDGKQVYTMGRDLTLADGLQMKSRLQRPDVNLQVYYPELFAAAGAALSPQFGQVNQRLQQVALGDYEGDYQNNDGTVNYMVRGGYRYAKAGNVVTVLQQTALDDYWVSSRAGSGPEWFYETVCFSSQTGGQFGLNALFAKGVNWRSDLLLPLKEVYAVSCAGQGIAENPAVTQALAERLDRNVPFLLDHQGVTVFIKLEDGSYQEIKVLYQDVEGIINQTGDLWLSLQQQQAAESSAAPAAGSPAATE